MSAEKKTCPECGVSIKAANYERHLQRVHKSTVEDIEGPMESGGLDKAKLFAVIAVALIVVSLFAYFLIFLNEPEEEPIVNSDDSDNDGLPDTWEIQYGLDEKNAADALLDFDGDGLANILEYYNGADPTDTDTDDDGLDDGFEVDNSQNPVDSDSDNDGIDDKYEVDNGLDPVVNDATSDSDFDGETNMDEYNAGTNPTSEVRATISVQGYGDIVVQLRPEEAKKTVENFVKYAEDGFYSGLIFHRIIDAFMVQGGGFNPDMTQKTPTYSPIALESPATTGLHHTDGAISMARTNDPNSATSQFFICDGAQSFLDGTSASDGYAVFGYVVSGMDVVRALSAVPTSQQSGMNDVPVTDVIISSVTISWID